MLRHTFFKLRRSTLHSTSFDFPLGYVSLIILAAAITSNVSISTSESNAEGKKLFRLEEVAKHNTIESGVWITFEGNVYDVTKFIPNHRTNSCLLLETI